MTQGECYSDAGGRDARVVDEDAVFQRVRDAYVAQAYPRKSHVTAGLLAIFLGAFGVHKFYLGYNQVGFVMLAVTVIGSILTFGLASAVIWVIAIVEGLVYLTRPQAVFDGLYVRGRREWF